MMFVRGREYLEEMSSSQVERRPSYMRDFYVSFANEIGANGDARLKVEARQERCSRYIEEFRDACAVNGNRRMKLKRMETKREQCSRYLEEFRDASDRHGPHFSLKKVDIGSFSHSLGIYYASQVAPPRTITKVEEKRGLLDILCSVGDVGHTALDIAGLVPMVGELADLANAGLYCLERDYANAAISAAAAIPYYGQAVTACKIGKMQANCDEIFEDIQDIAQKRRLDCDVAVPGGGGAGNAAVAIPALATGILIGAVGARKYWFRGLRYVVKIRRLFRR